MLHGHRARAGLVLVGGSLAGLFTVKHSQALFLGLCLAGAGAAIAVRRWPWRRGQGQGQGQGQAVGRGVVALAAVGCSAVVGTLLLAKALHYPSASESVQDLLADHFTRPDRTRPWPEFLHLQANFWTEWLRRQLWQPLFAAALAVGAWGALRGRRRAFGGFLVAAGCTGILTQAAHPDINIWGDRLIVPAWLLPVVGVPLLLERVARERVTLPAQERAERAHTMG